MNERPRETINRKTQIEAIKVEHLKQRTALNSNFNSSYERVIYEMLTSWIEGVGLSGVWTKETYNGVIKGLSKEVGSYFDIHVNSVSKQDLRQKIYTRYTPIWSEALENESNFTGNDKFVEFREKVISLKNKGKNNQDLIDFFDKLVETLVLTFEESKGLVYV
jgi:phage-related tail protein